MLKEGGSVPQSERVGGHRPEDTGKLGQSTLYKPEFWWVPSTEM
jgi:hypothetical protein